MNVAQLNHALATARADAIKARRLPLLRDAQTARVNANLYSSMGLYSVAARETIKAVAFENKARELTASTKDVW